MEKIQKITPVQTSNQTISTSIKKSKTMLTVAVAAVSLVGVFRPTEKPAQAQINPIVAGLIAGAVAGVANGINYDIAAHTEGYYNNYSPYVTPYNGYNNYSPYVTPYNGYNNYSPYVTPYNGYNNYSPYVTPYNGYNNYSPYVTPYNGYNAAPVPVTPYNGYNAAPVPVTPYNGYNAAPVPVTPYNGYNAAPVPVTPYNGYGRGFVGYIPSRKPVILTPAQAVYNQNLPHPKVITSWPEQVAIQKVLAIQKERLAIQQKELAIQKKLATQSELAIQKERLAIQQKERQNFNVTPSHSLNTTSLKLLKRTDQSSNKTKASPASGPVSVNNRTDAILLGAAMATGIMSFGAITLKRHEKDLF